MKTATAEMTSRDRALRDLTDIMLDREDGMHTVSLAIAESISTRCGTPQAVDTVAAAIAETMETIFHSLHGVELPDRDVGFPG